MADARPLRGRTAIKLIQECALGVRSEEELADEFGVSGPAIHYFKKRNVAAITDARQNIESEVAALWIAKLSARLAELQDDVERIDDRLDVADPSEWPKLLLAKYRALRGAAEQLGQLEPRQINVTGAAVRYEIVGVDLDKLA